MLSPDQVLAASLLKTSGGFLKENPDEKPAWLRGSLGNLWATFAIDGGASWLKANHRPGTRGERAKR